MLEVVSLAARNRYARFDASQFARKFQLGESHESRSKKLKKKLEGPDRASPDSRTEERDSISEVTSSWQPHAISRLEPTFWQTTSSARAPPKNSSFNSTLYHRLCTHSRRISLYFNHCPACASLERSTACTTLHSSDGTRFVFRDRNLTYRRNRCRQRTM